MINIYNTLGQKVFEKQDFIKEEYTINLSQFQKGTYFVSFIDKSEKVTKTIILN